MTNSAQIFSKQKNWCLHPYLKLPLTTGNVSNSPWADCWSWWRPSIFYAPWWSGLRFKVRRRYNNSDWRQNGLGPSIGSISIRIQLLRCTSFETHLIEELLKYKRLGLFDECPIERAHHTNNVFTDLFANIKNWFNRQDAIETRKHIAGVPDIQAALQSFDENSRRHFVLSSIEAARNKAAGEQAYKK